MVAVTSLTAWDERFVVDVACPEPLGAHLCPSHLSLSAVLHGQPPLPQDRPLTWIDLGSGGGAAACAVAAANPDVSVWGCDADPAHVERARTLAADAGLTATCTFDEASLVEVATDDDLGPAIADVIVVGGRCSAMSRADRLHLGEIVRRRLRPGGVVLVTYHVPTGSSAMTPVVEALRLRAQADARRSDLAFTTAADELHELADLGARSFPLAPHEAATFAALRTTDPRCTAQDLLGPHVRPLLFEEVDEVLQAARCSYLGSLEPTDHLDRLGAPPDVIDLVRGTADVVLRETLRDLVGHRSLRRDLYRRGLATATTVDREGWLRDLSLVGLAKPFVGTPSVPVPLGSVTLDPRFYIPLVEILATRSLTVADLLRVHRDLSFSDAIGSLALLVGGGYAAPEVPGWRDGPTVRRARRLNEALIEENRRGSDHRYLVSPATGGAITSEPVEMLTVGAVWSGADRDEDRLAEQVLGELARQHRIIDDDDADAEGVTLRAIVQRRVATALGRIDGLLTAHGIC